MKKTLIKTKSKPILSQKFKSKFKAMLSKLSSGIMLPIALLPIAGLFLGIGAAISNNIPADNPAFLFATLLKSAGQIVFDNLPILFAVGIAIAFTNQAGVAALSAFIAWAVFNITQNVFIGPEMLDTVTGEKYRLIFDAIRVSDKFFTNNIGILSMQTSVFGGITIGGFTAFLYNRFYKTKLPTIFGFFNGTRFVPIVSFIFAIYLGLVFLGIWPWIGIALSRIGSWLGSIGTTTGGFNTFIFGYIERALIPFGLHHVFYAPLWFTSAGGSVTIEQTSGIATTYQGDQTIWNALNATSLKFTDIAALGRGDVNFLKAANWSNIEQVANGDGWRGVKDGLTVTVSNGYSPAQYMQGKYPFMVLGLPAVGLAMIMAADKDKRRFATSIVASAAFTAFLTGITEPIEFTFLFLAPWLFYGVHAIIAASSFWAMYAIRAHTGMVFSGGFLDLMIYGAIPMQRGTGWYHALWIGAILMPIYYTIFYWAIKRFNIATPGRGTATRLLTKADLAEKKENSNLAKEDSTVLKSTIQKDSKAQSEFDKLSPMRKKALRVIEGLGGLDNLDSVNACASRLRVSVKDPKKVNEQIFRDLGSPGTMGQGSAALQIIFGGESDIIKSEIREIIDKEDKKN